MYLPTIGLEIHVELKTKTKMFCSCRNDPNEHHPNILICPTCLGHPGTLPTINKKAVEAVIKLGFALKGKIAGDSHFDRKSYFYPDLPKGYQISQYEKPLVEGGMLRGIRIRRIHLEEDTARLVHTEDGSSSLVDFNRAGVPLMELVTEPDIKNADEAVVFAREFQLILRYLGISDADMEKGQMRVEANISLNQGTKVEVKNINSFKAVHNAIEYELKRQEKVLKDGSKVRQETRGWDEKRGITLSQRSKEEAHDYRYFPEPDLPPIRIADGRASPAFAGGPPTDEINIDKIKAEIPELPEEKRHRFIKEFGLDKAMIETLIEDKAAADYFEEAVSELKSKLPVTPPAPTLRRAGNYQLLVNYFTSDLRGLMVEKGISIKEVNINPEHFAHLVTLVEKGELSSRLAKDLLRKMSETGEDPETLIKNEGLKVISDESELGKIVKEIIEKNPKAIEDYKKGKVNALQFLVGQAMACTKGQANPDILSRLFKKFIS